MSAFTFFTTAELRAQGMGRFDIQDAIAAGNLERVIRGWYCTPQTDREAVRAMRIGARLGCVSALRLHGAWCPPEMGVHLLFPSHASGRRTSIRGLPDDAFAHWYPKEARSGSAFAVAPLDLAVEQLLACQPHHFLIAVLDSLLHRRLLSRNRLEALIAGGPSRARPLLAHLEPRGDVPRSGGVLDTGDVSEWF